MFGRELETELDKVDGKTTKEIERKRERKLQQWLDIPLKYRNPPASKAKRLEELTSEL